MRNTLKDFLITEAKKASPQQTQTKTDDWESIFKSFNTPGGDTPDLPAAAPEPTPTPAPSRPATPPGGQRPAPQRARERLGNMDISDEMLSKFASMDLAADDDISNDQAAQNASVGHQDTPRALPAPDTPGTSLARMGTDVARQSGITPEWYTISQLPGYLASGIRRMGRDVFSLFTDTPIEDIQVLANINNSGPNDQQELDAVVTYLQREGTRKHDLEIDFGEKIPGYQAQVRAFTAVGHTFITVKDFAGKYVYAWKTGEGDLDKLQAPDVQDRPRLR